MPPVILLYHSINRVLSDPFGLRVSPKRFAEQMQVLASRWKPMPLAEMVAATEAGEAPADAVAVTFDDGYADNLYLALPVLGRLKIPATVFIATGYIGGNRECWWDELDSLLLRAGSLPAKLRLQTDDGLLERNLDGARSRGWLGVWRQRHWRCWMPAEHDARRALFSELRERLKQASPDRREALLQELRAWAGPRTVRPRRRLLTIDELRSLASSRLIEIGAHTVHHPSLGRLDDAEQHRQITESKAWLEGQLQRPIRTFSYPFGSLAESDYTEVTARLTRSAGLELACTTNPGSLTPGLDRFQLPRVNVLDWPADEFQARMHAACSPLGR